MDRAASRFGVDRAEIRRRNLVKPSAMPFTTPTGEVYDCGDFPRLMESALRYADWTGFPLRKKEAAKRGRLRGTDGRAYLTDFQLAVCFHRPGPLFRLAAYEDRRHLLKHQRRYAPGSLTAAERRVLARKSWLSRVWMATGKKVYQWITRGLFRFTDREGSGLRLVCDAPVIAAQLKTHPQVRDVAVVAFPKRGSGTGLYAFVEGTAGLSEHALRQFFGERAP